MRGGEKFWDFRTFNPPISKNNWANEYTETCEIQRTDSTLVVRNTYLDVPRHWLGEQFIEEAEELKRINERAYIHEYLGKAIGTGGDVFPNVSDMNMEELVPKLDPYGNEIAKIPMWQTFDKVYNGIDWGFAIDPTRFVKLYFDKDQLDVYIFDEYTTYKNRIENIYHALYEDLKKVRNDELVIADSGGGGSFAIADFKAYGAFIRQAQKGPESVNYGIKWLQGLRHIYIDKRRCPDTYKEFVNYEYEQDKDGNFISAYPDENNHSIDAVRYALEKYANRKGN
jgi:phage terminase large subunit